MSDEIAEDVEVWLRVEPGCCGGAPRVAVPSEFPIFGAQFFRSDYDLTALGANGERLLVADYFAWSQPPHFVRGDSDFVGGDLITRSAVYNPAAGRSAAMHAPVGEVTAVAGRVIVLRDSGEMAELESGDRVRQGDVLLFDGGKATISFPDGSRLDAGETGRVIVQKLVATASGDDPRVVLYAGGGSFAYMPSPASSGADGAAVAIETPAAHIGPARSAFAFRYNAETGLRVWLLEDADRTPIVVENNEGNAQLGEAGARLDVAGADAAPVVLPKEGSQHDADSVAPAPVESSALTERSPGGDEGAYPGDPIVVTGATDPFDLVPEAAPLVAPPASGILLQSASLPTGARHLTEELLLRRNSDAISPTKPPELEEGKLLANWDHEPGGGTWVVRGAADVFGPVPEVAPNGSPRPISPMEGQHMALVEPDPGGMGDIDSFLGLLPQTVTEAVAGTQPAAGSAIKRTMTLTAGSELSFDWFFDAGNESPRKDFALFTIDGRAFVLADSVATGVGGATGWRTFVYTVTTTKEVTVGFVAVNDLTPDSPSRLMVDNVRIGRAFGENFVVVDGGTAVGWRVLLQKPIVTEDAFAVGEDGRIATTAATLLANDVDPDPFDAMGISGFDRTGTVGRVSFTSTGEVVYDTAGRFERLSAGETATDSFRYEVDAGNGIRDFGTVRVTIIGANDAPTAGVVKTEQTAAGAAIAIDVLASADDIDGDDDRTSLKLVAATSASGTEVSFTGNAGNGIVYRPDSRFVALAEGETLVDRITYTIADRHGARTVGTADVRVVGVNDGPSAVDDRIDTTEDAPVAFDALANDSDPDRSDRLGVVAIDGTSAAAGSRIALASGAAVTLAADGRLVYDPTGSFDELALGETRTDTFRYRIDDGHGGTAEALASVRIEGRNDAPQGVADKATAAEDGPAVLIDVLANDDDVDSDDDRSSLRIVAASASSGAAVGVSGRTGEGVTYSAGGRFEALAEGETGRDTITYVVQDRHGGQATSTVAVAVTGANDAPAAADDQLTVSEDAGVSVAVLANDHDPDASDRLQVAGIDGKPIGAGGQVHLQSGAIVMLGADGTLTYDPNGRFETLSVAQIAIDRFRYTVGDGHGSVAEAVTTVTIEGRNDAPTARDDDGAAFEDGPVVVFDVLANDDDPDSDDDRSSLRIVGAKALSGATVTFSGIAGAGLTYNAAGRFDFVGEGETATDVVTYTVEDRHGARSTATVKVTIIGANDPPQARADLLMVDANSVLSLPPVGILGNDLNLDASDRLRIIAVNGVAADVGRTVTLASGALLTIDSAGNLIYDPNHRFDGLNDFERVTDVFEYTVSDDHGATATASVAVQVQGRNDPPDASADAAVTDQDSAVRIPVLINDHDPDAGGNLRVLSVDTAASRGAVRMNADGTLTYDPNGAFDELRPGETAVDTFLYVVDDFVGGRSTASVTVTINGSARPQHSHQELLQSFELPPLPNTAWPGLGTLQTSTLFPLETGGGLVPTHAATMAVLTANGASAGALEMFLSEDITFAGRALVRLPDDAIDRSSPHSGAAMRSALSLSAADVAGGRVTLSFDWAFASAEPNPIPSGINDFAVFTLSNETIARVFTLTDARSTSGISDGWRTTTVDVTAYFSLPTIGNLNLLLGFAVVNDQTPWNPSQLLLDNVRLNRPIGAEFELVRSDAGGSVATFRQRPEAVDDIVANAGAVAIDEDRPVNLAAANFLGNDRPSPGATAATLRLMGVDASGTLGLVTLSGGNVVYDPHGRFDTLAQRETGTDQFGYIVSDANGGTTIGRATIVVTGVNDAPVAVADTAVIAEHSGPVALDVLQNDDDIDSDDDRSMLRIVAAGTASGAAVSFSGIAGAGLVYDPRNVAAFVGLGVGEIASDTVIYTIEDRHGARSTSSVAVTVTGVNDAPTARADQAATDEDTPVTIAVLANDTDPDLRDRLVVGAVNGIATSPGAQVALVSGAVILVSADGTVRYDPGAAFASLARGQAGSDSFVYTASDGHGGTSQASVAVSIAGRNDPPVAGADALSTDAATRLTVAATSLLSNDHDPDLGNRLHLVDLDATGTLGNVSFDGTSIQYDPAGRFLALGEGETQTDSFTYRVADVDGALATGHVTVTVRGINDAPKAVDDAATTDEDKALTVHVLTNDSDPDAHDQLSVLSVDTTGTLGRVTVAGDGTINYDPQGRFDYLNAGQTAHDTFRYRISDGHGGTDDAQVTVTINGRSSIERLVDSFESPFAVANRTTTAVTTVGSYQETDGARGLYSPTDGNFMARLEAFGTPAQVVGQETVSKLEGFLGIPNRSLPRDPVDATFPANGSAFKLKVAVAAGDQVSFDWMFDARDILPDNDYAVCTVVGAGAPQIFTLSDVRETGSAGATGWRSAIYTASAAGELTIGLAVVNDRSTVPATENSYLLVDNVRLNRDFGESYQVTHTDPHGPFETIVLT